MKIFLRVIQWLFITLILWIIILLIAVYFSSLNAYKESDFNIPKDFFVTKFWDKDPYSEKNWFEDFIKFNELLWKSNLEYFDIESKCIFDKEQMREWECEERKKRYFNKMMKDLSEIERNEVLEKQFKKLKNFVAVNKIRYRNINEKEYILLTPEYSWLFWKSIIYTGVIQYSRLVRYVAYKYFDKWKYEQWINVLLEYQWFIDNLINKYDWNLITSMAIVTMNNINNESLEYFIDNYELSKELKNKIEISLNNEIDKWFFNNSTKWEYKFYKDNFKNIVSSYDGLNTILDVDSWIFKKEYKNITSILERLFFVSKDETNLLFKKVFYDLINNDSLVFFNNLCGDKGVSFNFINLNNYVWRTIICHTWISVFSSQFKKEQDMQNSRLKLLEKVK